MISSTVVTILFDEYLRLTNQEEIFEAKEMFYKTSDKSKSYVQMMEEIEKKEKKTSKENDKYQKPNVTIESVYVDPTAKVNDKKVLLDLMNMIIVTHQEQGFQNTFRTAMLMKDLINNSPDLPQLLKICALSLKRIILNEDFIQKFEENENRFIRMKRLIEAQQMREVFVFDSFEKVQNYVKQIRELNKSFNDFLQIKKKYNENNILLIKENFLFNSEMFLSFEKLTKEIENTKNEFKNYRAQYQNEMEQMKLQHQNEIEQMKLQHQNEIEQMKTQHKKEIEQMKNEIGKMQTVQASLILNKDSMKELVVDPIVKKLDEIHNDTKVINDIKKDTEIIKKSTRNIRKDTKNIKMNIKCTSNNINRITRNSRIIKATVKEIRDYDDKGYGKSLYEIFKHSDKLLEKIAENTEENETTPYANNNLDKEDNTEMNLEIEDSKAHKNFN